MSQVRRSNGPLAAGLLVIAAVGVAGCGDSPSDESAGAPLATVEPIKSGRRSSPRRSPGRTSARTGSASSARPTTTRGWPRSRRPRPPPGAVPRHPDLAQGADRRGPRRGGRADRRPGFGSDLKEFKVQADRVREALRNVDGLEDLHTDLVADVPEIEVTENLAAARRYGLKPGDVRRAAGVLVASEEVGD